MKSSSGSDNKDETIFPKGHDSVLGLRCNGKASASFNAEVLNKLLEGAKEVSEVVGLSLSDDMPLKMDVELPRGSLVYWLAPAIDV